MEIIKLPKGERADDDADCVHIAANADGKFELVGTALDGEDTISIMDGEPYSTYDDAEAAGLAWADGHGVERLFVSTS